MKQVDLILTSDWHLREDTPVCRTDDFWEAQWNKVDQISKLQKKYDCPVIHAGDLFHHWKPSPWLLSTTISMIPDSFHTVFGQHDLPQHNLDLDHKSGINVLRQAGKIVVLNGGSWGQEPGHNYIQGGKPSYNVSVWHKFIWDGKNLPWPGCDGLTAKQVLKKYPEFDLIVTGDHHKPFAEYYVRKKKHRVLVNPGCLTRQASDYAEHRPRVYLWEAESNTVEPVYLKIKKGVVSRDHIEKKEQLDKRIEAFIGRLSSDWETVTSFEENLKRFFASNWVRKSVSNLIYKAIDE